uniref:Uncharacterized protein n=1 Tax=Rhizophagus irregularis (strain DAOM 181602 / DAOM 197198 / MUCL 43194) TaxID=747089 RepID=U9UR36_RHIID
MEEFKLSDDVIEQIKDFDYEGLTEEQNFNCNDSTCNISSINKDFNLKGLQP